MGLADSQPQEAAVDQVFQIGRCDMVTRSERKAIADRLRAAVSGAEGLSESIPFKYGWLQQDILCLAEDLEAGKEMKTNEQSTATGPA